MRIPILFKSAITVVLSALVSFNADAVTIGIGDSLYRPELSGAFRVKYEYNTLNGLGRFKIRNAIIGLSGKILPQFSYKIEADFDNNGKFKMRDTYGRFSTKSGNAFVSLGLMRAPFGIDVMRSPYLQEFANRSFIAKTMCNVRDVGLRAMYRTSWKVPVSIDGGVFTGSSIEESDNGWTKSYILTAKITAEFAKRFTLTSSVMRTRPNHNAVMHYDFGAFYNDPLWHFEGEFIYKNYSRPAGTPELSIGEAYGVNSFFIRRFPLNGGKSALRTISAEGRYDYMSKHCDAKADSEVTAARHRMTVGTTLHFTIGPVWAETRLNFEKYFYPSTSLPSPDEDKLVLELVCRF